MYKELEFDNWNELKSFLSTLNSNWIFRGQADYNWKLETTIDRVKFKVENVPNQKKLFEEYCVFLFQRNPDLYRNKYTVHSDFQAIATLQHYGAPTRLLDFTLSQYVATFFALSNLDKNMDGAIYAIEYMQLLSSTSHLFKLEYDDGSEEVEIFKKTSNISDDITFSKLVLNKRQRPFVQMVLPFYFFDRMIQQSGCFLCQGDVNEDFETNLQKNYNILQNIVDCKPYYKIKVKQGWKDEIVRDLERMNITYQSLFPGIEGFTKSLKDKFDIKMKDTGQSLFDNHS